MSNFKGSKPATKTELQGLLRDLTSLRTRVYTLAAPGAPELEQEVRNLEELLHPVSVAICEALGRAEKRFDYNK